jgi:hypothetical protein
VDTKNIRSERYTQKTKGRTSKNRRTKQQKKNDPVKEDQRVSKGKTETERGKHWPANARALALPPSIPAPPGSPPLNNRSEKKHKRTNTDEEEKKQRTETSRKRGQTRTKKESNRI